MTPSGIATSKVYQGFESAAPAPTFPAPNSPDTLPDTLWVSVLAYNNKNNNAEGAPFCTLNAIGFLPLASRPVRTAAPRP